MPYSEVILVYYCPCCRQTMRRVVDPRRAPRGEDVEATLRQMATEHSTACASTIARALRTAELRARSFRLTCGDAKGVLERTPPILGNGRPSTLGEWRRLAAANMGEAGPATAYLDDQIAALGEGAPVFVEEGEAIRLLLMMGKAAPAAGPWRTDAPPRDGRPFLAELEGGEVVVLRFEDPEDGEGGFWLVPAFKNGVMSCEKPKRWAEIAR
jgi:hypothetical protein